MEDSIHPSSLIIHHSAIAISVQAAGRRGYAALGLPESGPLDPYAHAAANLLLGNAPDAAALEIIGLGAGPHFYCTAGGLLAIAGADLGATMNGNPIPPWQTLWLRAGETLCFTGRTNIEGNGGIAYLAVAGGLALPPYLGSSSAYLGAAGALPDLAGRYLSAGDELPFGRRGEASAAGCAWPLDEGDLYPGNVAIPLIWGPHASRLGRSGKATLLAQQWTVGESNRMGTRLVGAALAVSGGELVSTGVVRGVVQLPSSGLPIILGPDHQTTGGYPLVAVVPSAGWPALGQLLPGDKFRFQLTTLAQAQRTAIRQHERRLAATRRLSIAKFDQYQYI